MNWEELLKQFSEAVATAVSEAGDDSVKVKTILDSATAGLPKEVSQHLTDRGFGAAKPEITKLTTKIESKDKEIEKLNKTLTAERENAPDVNGVRQEYDTKFTNQETEHKTALQAKDTEIAGAYIDAFMDRVGSELKGLGARGSIVGYKVKDEALRARVRRNEDKTFTLGKAEDPTLPSVPAANVSLERHLAEEIFAGLDPEDKKAQQSTGPGITPGGGPNGLNKTAAEHQAAYEQSKASRPNPLRPAAPPST